MDETLHDSVNGNNDASKMPTMSHFAAAGVATMS